MLHRASPAPWRVLVVMICAVLLGLGLAGCAEDGESPVVPECVEADVLRFPPTEDQLLASFRQAYEAMDTELYLALLDPGFETILQASTVAEFPDVGPTLDHAEEAVIAARMFGGETFTNSKGDLVPVLSAINFEIFAQRGAWATAGPESGFPGARVAEFEILMLWDRAGWSTLRTSGVVRMYVAEADSVVCGEDVNFHRLVGIVDLTNAGGKAATEETALGAVKAFFW